MVIVVFGLELCLLFNVVAALTQLGNVLYDFQKRDEGVTKGSSLYITYFLAMIKTCPDHYVLSTKVPSTM